MSKLQQTDELCFAAEEPTPASNPAPALPLNASNWKILIVDDESSVHAVTKLALQNFKFAGQSLTFFSAYSGAEAKLLIQQHSDIAMILLDVVMETDDAGLEVARFIREDLKNPFARIILRTGQAGQAPEEKVVLEYDINDYKEKTELTARKLFTTVISSLRAYRDLMIIDANRKGLEKIIEASSTIFKMQSMTKFVSGVLTQLIAILGLDKNSVYCRASGFAATKNDGEFLILAATGDYQNSVNKKINEVLPATLQEELNLVFQTKDSKYFSDHFIGYFNSSLGSESIIYLQGLNDLDEMSKDLISVFFTNVSTGFDNLYLNQELSDNQAELLFTLGEIAEIRSQETGNHVKRVAKYSKLLALKYGLSTEEAEVLNLASSMHDIGKLAIRDTILNKPGELTPEEFNIIKTHALAGYQLLKTSRRKLLQTAAQVALQHHEKYNGTGYPYGLKGEEIHIYGRITAIADVFDALSSDRVYRKAWPFEKVLDYIQEQRGCHFDPVLVDILFDNLDEFIKIRDACDDDYNGCIICQP